MVHINLLFLLLCGITLGDITDYKRVCYYGAWEIYGKGIYKFSPDSIADLNICTHYIYSFAGVDPKAKTIIPLEAADEITGYTKLTDKKKISPDITVMLAIGGWSFGVDEFSELTKTNSSMEEFCDNTIRYLRKWRFDGIDVDWEYPGSRGSPPEDKNNFATLLEKLRARFDREAKETGNRRLLLSSAVPINKYIVDEGFDRKRIGRAVDFLNVMVYDLYSSFSDKVGHHAPLYPRKGASSADLQLNAEWGMRYWAEKVKREKLILGLPIYSRTFTMNTTVNEPGHWNLSANIAFTTVTTDRYYQICEYLKDGKWKEDWDEEQSVPFAYSDIEWAGYDNERSVQAKADFVKDNHYGGLMVWQLASDDFIGSSCGRGKFPIMNAIRKSLESSRGDCGPGMYGHINRKGCLPCPKNTYQPSSKSTSCLDCPPGTNTKFEGAVWREKCISRCTMVPNYCANGDCRPADSPDGVMCKCWKGFQGLYCEESVGGMPMKRGMWMHRLDLITSSFTVLTSVLLFIMVIILACICRRLSGTQMKYVVNHNGLYQK